MAVDLGSVGRSLGPREVHWSARDVMLYALGVGAGQADACQELEYTTENSTGVALKVLPTFALTLVQRAALRPGFGDVDLSDIVHAGQRLSLHQPLDIDGTVAVSAAIGAVEPKRSGTLVHVDSDLRSPRGSLVAQARSTLFVRRCADGARLPGRTAQEVEAPGPDAPAVRRILAPTRPDQALLYRLAGDVNPLHSDPLVAERAGHGRPILHGLCSLGTAVRRLLSEFRLDAGAVRGVEARFTGPVWPGETLAIDAVRADQALRFSARAEGGRPVLAAGVLHFDGALRPTGLAAVNLRRC
ncbi:MaoC/PaaZ C-terminal domain-containing protein [Aquincola sp. MAHUQ-54]|uniref:MaoC/PaaZ C-terminal domain-containing protein n=1 Tax=Aquincola agrisoli TaxID=3119538 RepID=A0AAW9QAM2_9BURK